MGDQVKFGTPLKSAFGPCRPHCFITFAELVTERYINGFENSGIYKQPLSYLAKDLFLKKSKLLIMFTINESLYQLS